MFTTTTQVAQVDPAAFEPVPFRVTDDGFAEFPPDPDAVTEWKKAAAHAAIEGEEPGAEPQPKQVPLAEIDGATLLRVAFQMRRRDLAKAAVFTEIAGRLNG